MEIFLEDSLVRIVLNLDLKLDTSFRVKITVNKW